MSRRRIAIVHFSGTGTTDRLAEAVREGAEAVAGTDVVVHRIVGREIVEGRFVNERCLDLIDTADGVIFGSPTYMGGPAAEFKAFADATSDRWTNLRWEGKIAAGFTVGANPAGDQLATLPYFGVLAAQHGMLWIGLDLPGGFDAAGRNRLGTQLGASAHATSPAPEASDLATATRLGGRVAEVCARLDARPAVLSATPPVETTPAGTALPERMETRRLILRRPVASDAVPIFERYATDPEVVRYLSWTPHENVVETRAFVESERARWESGTDGDGRAWTLLLEAREDASSADAEVVGMIDLRIDGFRAEIGYVLAKAHWGQGLMSEALAAVRDAALALPAIRRIQMVCDVDNPASARVMEKAGFEREGVLQGYYVHPNVSNEPRDCLRYAFVRR